MIVVPACRGHRIEVAAVPVAYGSDVGSSDVTARQASGRNAGDDTGRD
jgi:hypothetical protein